LFQLASGNGDAFNLGISGTGLPGDEATYTFVATGESGNPPWGATVPPLGGGIGDALQWGAPGGGPYLRNGWFYTVDDPAQFEGGAIGNITIEFTSIPEPTGVLALMCFGTAVLSFRRRRK
jgi:hypothetical protein